MQRLLALVAVTSVVLLGAGTIPLGQTFSLRVSETAHIDKGNLTLTFKGVTDDSRCPRGVNCIVAGQATVVLVAQVSHGPRADLTLNVPPEGHPTLRFQGYTLTITALEPYPEYGKPIAPDDYRVKILVIQP